MKKYTHYFRYCLKILETLHIKSASFWLLIFHLNSAIKNPRNLTPFLHTLHAVDQRTEARHSKSVLRMCIQLQLKATAEVTTNVPVQFPNPHKIQRNSRNREFPIYFVGSLFHIVILVIAATTQGYIQWVLIPLMSQLLTRPWGRQIVRANDFLFQCFNMLNTLITSKSPILVSSPHQEVSFGILKQYLLSVHMYIFF